MHRREGLLFNTLTLESNAEMREGTRRVDTVDRLLYLLY
jgi:hypothetical protein